VILNDQNKYIILYNFIKIFDGEEEFYFSSKNSCVLDARIIQCIFMASCVLQSDTFQEDLFPDTAAPTPAVSARDWINGRNCNPVLMSMNTGKGVLTQEKLTLTCLFTNCLASLCHSLLHLSNYTDSIFAQDLYMSVHSGTSKMALAKLVNCAVFVVSYGSCLVSRCGHPNTQTTASSHFCGFSRNTSCSQQQ
jgi:hypothetical protein